MAFQKPKQQPNFATLKSTLAQTKEAEHPLYQTIQILIERLMQFQGITVKDIADINASVNNILSIINTVADKNRTYITETDESLNLPNSRKLVAGSNVTFNIATPNQLRIDVATPTTATDHVPLCLGGEPLEFMSDGDGSSILIEYTPGT